MQGIKVGSIVFLECFTPEKSEILEAKVTYVGRKNFTVGSYSFSLETGIAEQKTASPFNKRVWFTLDDYHDSDGESMVRAKLARMRNRLHLLPIEKVIMILDIVEE